MDGDALQQPRSRRIVFPALPAAITVEYAGCVAIANLRNVKCRIHG